jgi:hypothetical protein
MKHLEKLMMKKHGEGKTLSKSAAKAKSSVLEDLMSDMFDHEGDKVKGLKKVTVASNSPKGLEKGLDKAKEMLGEKGMSDEDMPEEESSEMEESPEMEASEHEDEEEMSPEEIEAKIAELKELLKEKKMKA